ncbi:MAG: hypothetical protein JWN42_15 [Candidatus Angelobacter sp.]|nr:hypothetical protein [Candidatus Angelobacter sp.]
MKFFASTKAIEQLNRRTSHATTSNITRHGKNPNPKIRLVISYLWLLLYFGCGPVTRAIAQAPTVNEPPAQPYSILIFPERDFVSTAGHADGTTANATAKFTVTSTPGVHSISLVASKNPTSGKAFVFVDGSSTAAATIDLYSATTQMRQVVFTIAVSPSTSTHSLLVKVAGTKNAASTGTRVMWMHSQPCVKWGIPQQAHRRCRCSGRGSANLDLSRDR